MQNQIIRIYLTLITLFLPQVGLAYCEFQTNTEYYERAATVLIGHVESVSVDNGHAKIRVDHVIKGNNIEQFYVYNSLFACSIRFVKEGLYLLYLFKPDEHGHYTIGMCSGSVRIDSSAP